MAASLCKKHVADPRAIYESHLTELQELMRRGVGYVKRSTMTQPGWTAPERCDVLLVDTQVGLNEASLACFAISDALLVVLRLDDFAHAKADATAGPTRWLAHTGAPPPFLLHRRLRI